MPIYCSSPACLKYVNVNLLLLFEYSLIFPPLPPFFLPPTPRVQSEAYRSSVNPFISILPSWRFKDRAEEKMGSGWYHWVSRWVGMSVRFNGGWRDVWGSLPKVSASDPPDFSRRKQTSSGFSPESALNVKWTAGDEAAPWGSLSWDELQQENNTEEISV